MFLFKFVSDLITIACLAVVCGIPAFLNIIFYPFSKKMGLKVSSYIQKRVAPMMFAILAKYKKFNFIGEIAEGVQVPDQFLVLSNHQSLFDIPVYMNFLRDKSLRFVAKAELARHVPLVSEMLRIEEHCIVPRSGSPSVSMKVLDDFGKRVIERNQIPILFPEGTRSRDGNLGKFYSAGFRRLSDIANLPVAVCALDGGYQIGNLTRIMANLNHGCYRVKILAVFPCPHGKNEQQELLKKAKEMIQAQIEEWRR